MKDNWYIILGLEFDPPVEDEQIIEDRISEKAKYWATHSNDFKMGGRYRILCQYVPKIKADMLGSSNRRRQIAEEACNIVYPCVDKLIQVIGRKGYLTSEECEKIAKKFSVSTSVVNRRVNELFGSQRQTTDITIENEYEKIIYNTPQFDAMKIQLDSLGMDNLYTFLFSDMGNVKDLPCDVLITRAREIKKTKYYKNDFISGVGAKLCLCCERIFKDFRSKEEYDKYLKNLKIHSILEEVCTIFEITGELTNDVVEEIILKLTIELGDNKLAKKLFCDYLSYKKIEIMNSDNTFQICNVDKLEQVIEASECIRSLQQRVNELEQKLYENIKVDALEIGSENIRYAYMGENGNLAITRNQDGENYTPMYVNVDPQDGSMEAGRIAKELWFIDPENTAFILRNRLWSDVSIFRDVEITGINALTFLINKVRQDASLFGDKIGKNVILTCPSYYTFNEIRPLKKAVEQAGLNVVNVISESRAIAEYYKNLSHTWSEFIIIHISEHESHIELLCLENEEAYIVDRKYEELGSREWTYIVKKYLVNEFCMETGAIEDEFDEYALKDFCEKSERARKKLATKEETLVLLDAFGLKAKIKLSRTCLNNLSDSLFITIIEKINDIVNSSLISTPCKRFVLVGDSAIMFQLQGILKNEYCDCETVYFPSEAVVKGALLYANRAHEYSFSVKEG